MDGSNADGFPFVVFENRLRLGFGDNTPSSFDLDPGGVLLGFLNCFWLLDSASARFYRLFLDCWMLLQPEFQECFPPLLLSLVVPLGSRSLVGFPSIFLAAGCRSSLGLIGECLFAESSPPRL